MAKEQLTRYRAKRDFTKTREPSGQNKVGSSTQLRFVVQKHAARRLHYDLRLELDGVFKSWAVTRGPSLDPADKRLAVEVEDHPLDYGDFEGTIPAGEYGGGTVQIWDRGYWIPEGSKTPQEALSAGDLKFTADGARMRGSWVLVRMRHDRNGGKRTNWLLIKHRDDAAMPGEGDALLHEDRSVASGRSLAEIEQGRGAAPKPFMLSRRKPQRADAVWHSNREPTPKAQKPAAQSKRLLVEKLPTFIEPQLCKSVELPPQYEGWGHEVKLDGYRTQLRVERGNAALRTRTGLDWSDKFSSIATQAKALPDCILDGEVVALDDKGMPNFSALQAALSDGDSRSLLYFAFDMLFEGKEDLRGLPLLERKRRLQKLLGRHPKLTQVRYVAHLETNGHEVFASAKKMQYEGIVSKKLDAPYRSGRAGTWTKAKSRPGQELVVGGFTSESGEVRSLLTGVYRKGVLEYAGRVGTGFGRGVNAKLAPWLEGLVVRNNPFAGANVPPKESNVRWVKPELVVEVEFAGWTEERIIRQAAFKGMREDKPAREVVDEISAPALSEPPVPAARPTGRTKGAAGLVQVEGITISHPDKELWPAREGKAAVTKRMLAEYFAAVGEWMLPHLQGRPCSLVRMPDGVGGEKFFQRHAAAGMSDQFTSVKVRGDKAPYVQIDSIAALVAAAQFGTLELHPWNCVPDHVEVAGRLVFDLDPAPDVKFADVVQAALEVRERLERVGLKSFCKTTGGKGLHVVTPLLDGNEAVPWPTAKDFAHIVCAQMAADSPTRYLDVMTKSQRTGRIFLDYLRNDRLATAVAVLSPRARELPTVSMPLDWSAVRADLDPTRFTVHGVADRLGKSRPWKDYARSERSLAEAIRRVTQTSAASSAPKSKKSVKRRAR